MVNLARMGTQVKTKLTVRPQKLSFHSSIFQENQTHLGQLLSKTSFSLPPIIPNYCNNSLPRGGVHWKKRPLRQFAPQGPWDCPRAMSRAKGYFKTYFPIHPVSRQCIAIFLPERECIGNYTPISRVVLTVYDFNTLPLYKKEWKKATFLVRS